MADLRRFFEDLGFANVETFIACGNVIFNAVAQDTPALEKQIESHLQRSLGYAVATFIRSAPELAAIATYRPFAAADLDAVGTSLSIAFLPAPPGAEAQQRLMTFRTEADDFHVQGRELYWLRRQPISESTFSGALLEKTIGMPATIRNATTVKRLAARYLVS